MIDSPARGAHEAPIHTTGTRRTVDFGPLLGDILRLQKARGFSSLAECVRALCRTGIENWQQQVKPFNGEE